MDRFNPTLAVAFVFATAFSAGALAQNQAVPAPKPSVKQTTASKNSHAIMKKTSVGEVRNWKAIDKNHDNLIEPEEMESYLKQGKAQAKKS